MKPRAPLRSLIRELEGFDCRISSLDRIWTVLFPDPADRWYQLHVTRYEDVYYLTHVDGDLGSLSISPDGTILEAERRHAYGMGRTGTPEETAAAWADLAELALRWSRVLGKDWIRANRRVQLEYPLNRRYGLLPHAVVRSSMPDLYRLDRELGKAGTRKMVGLVESGYFIRRENTVAPSMTANEYFGYCRIAYLAGRRKEDVVDESLSGREMYVRFADGRHDGLLDIDPDSSSEFADWIDGRHPKRGRGGHPWEIKRGGNTTHIDLSVYRPWHGSEEGFKIEVAGESIGRLVEAIRMFLAIQDAGLPISISNPEGVRKRLLAQDDIGILPAYETLHRANQREWRSPDVFDVMYYDDLGRFKRRAAPFVSWEPLPILKPRG